MKVDYNADICVVGLGPAGIGAALAFSQNNLGSRLICLDEGKHHNDRYCSVIHNIDCMSESPCQVTSGFGGCSLLSGGKISMFPAGSNLAEILGSEDMAKISMSQALDLFNNYLKLNIDNKKTINIQEGSDFFKKMGFKYKYYNSCLCSNGDLLNAYKKIFQDLTSDGVKLLLQTKVIKIEYDKGRFIVTAKHNGQLITIYTIHIILAVGRSGSRFMKTLNTELNLDGRDNHLDVGVRIEFPTRLYEDIDKYHNDLKLLFNPNARTFCVCKNGKIVSYYSENISFTEGSESLSTGDNLTNFAIMVRLNPPIDTTYIYDDIKKRMLYLGKGKLVCQRLDDYLINNDCEKFNTPIKSSTSFWKLNSIDQCFPRSVSVKIREAISHVAIQLLPKNNWDEVNLFAPEVDHSGLYFPVQKNFSICSGIYIIGDCTGKFRGILQAFCSGMVCARSIMSECYEKENLSLYL
jgi:hypothetical protein